MKPQSVETISIDEVRSHFPALERIYNGFPVAYFDGPGGTQVPRAVVDVMSDYLYHHNANTHWGYPTSDETDAMIDDARLAFADFFNAEADEIVFGQNMTSLTFHLARALGRRFAPGDEIIVTELDHHGNVDTWRSLEIDRGVVIRTVPMNVETGQLEVEKLPELLSKKTKLVAIGAASNALGTINDVGYFVDAAREVGALSFVDAHVETHRWVDSADPLGPQMQSLMAIRSWELEWKQRSPAAQILSGCIPEAPFRQLVVIRQNVSERFIKTCPLWP